MKKIEELLNPINNIDNIGLRPCTDDEKPLMFIPSDRSYVQILDYKIDGFKSFEDFVEYLQHIKKVEEENKQLKSDKDILIAYLEEKIEESILYRTYECGMYFTSIQERIYKEILAKVKGEENDE